MQCEAAKGARVAPKTAFGQVNLLLHLVFALRIGLRVAAL